MQRPMIPTILSVCLLAAFAITSIGCSSMNSMSNRVLKSMVLSPATADAQTSASGQVQYTAMGTFSMAPSPAPVPFVAPYSGSWATSDLNVATIDQHGLAVCVAGASGTVTITAIASSNAGMGTQNTSTAVSGTAKLTCP
ncbi:MAG: hypothetical protein ACRD3P_11425 [Terriglobales bacterium]